MDVRASVERNPITSARGRIRRSSEPDPRRPRTPSKGTPGHRHRRRR